MNILFISELSNLGGGETSLLNTMINFKKYNKKINPILFCINEGELTKQCEKNNIDYKIYDFKEDIKSINIIRQLKGMLKIKTILKDNNIDIIQSNEWKPAIVFSFVNKIFNLNCKVIWMCHGQWYSFNKSKRYFINVFIDKIIAVSNIVKQNLIKNKIKASKIEHIPLGIDLNKYENGYGDKIKNEFNIKEDEILLGTIGRFQEIKGQKLAVETMKLLVKENKNYKMLMVGDCIFNNEKDENYKKEVLNLIKEYNLEESIILTGVRNDIPDILKALDVLVIPSINESFGMVVIEAFAAGCIVVSTPCDGPKETIKNNNTGFILKERDASELKKVITRINNKQLLLNIKNNLKEEKKKYDINNICNIYQDIYEYVLGIK